MSKFDLEKAMKNGGKCQTRNGRPARIICTDLKDKEQSLVVVVQSIYTCKDESVEQYCATGSYRPGRLDSWDLTNIPEKHILEYDLVLFRDIDGEPYVHQSHARGTLFDGKTSKEYYAEYPHYFCIYPITIEVED